MSCVNTIEVDEPVAAATACNLRLPMGLLGFEQDKDFLLIANPEEEPFRWLQVKDNPSLAFIVVEPFLVTPEYKPDIPQQDAEFLGLSSSNDALLYSIVTLHGTRPPTVNLKGPVVINRSTGVAKQVIIANAAQYSVQHPLPVE